MKRQLYRIREHLQSAMTLLFLPGNTDHEKVLEHLRDLPILIATFENEIIYGPLMSVLHSILTDPVRGNEREKLQQGIESILAMVDNLDRGETHLNEKLQQQFFKKWLSPRFQTNRDEPLEDEVSSADYLEDDDNIDQFFVLESKENIARLRACLHDFRSEKLWQEALAEFKAIVHTIKGSAGIVGDKAVGKLAHALEEALDIRQQPSTAILTLIEQVIDAFKWLIDNISPQGLAASDLPRRNARADMIIRLLEDYSEQPQLSLEHVAQRNDIDQLPAFEEKNGSSGIVPLERLSSLMEEGDSTRAMLLEDLRQIRNIGQSIAHSNRSLEDSIMSGQTAKMTSKSTTKSKEAKKNFKSRMREIFSDLEEYYRLMEQRLEGCQEELDKLQELSTRLWKEVARSRRIAFGRMFGVLQKTVKELAAEQGVEVRFVAHGGDLQVEKKLFETLFDPLLQLIRNAISHGIEPPDERRRLGKAPEGTIELAVEMRDDDLSISVTDDGRGLSLAALKRKSRERRFASLAKDCEPEELIFISGLTTKDSINEVAGRGIGMDVVGTGINKLNGLVQVESQEGKFTRFHLRLPASRFYTSVYIVRSMGHLFVVPAALVNADDHQNIFFKRASYPVVSLTSVLGGRSINRPSLLVGGVEKRFYLEVDEIIGSQSVVLTKLGKFFKSMPLIWGATLVREGEMAFVLNLRYLYETAVQKPTQAVKIKERVPRMQRRAGDTTTILAIDDSISVREFLKSVLTKNGYEVHLANDGAEGLHLARRHDYSLIITDLEMPKMGGYEFMEQLRRMAPQLATPILVITSRSIVEEKPRGEALGVADFMAKPFSEKELLRQIKRLLSTSKSTELQSP